MLVLSWATVGAPIMRAAAETLAKIDFFMVASPFQKGDNHSATAQQTPSFTKVIAAYTRTPRSCRFFACHSPTTYRSGIRPEKLNEPHFNSCSGSPVIPPLVFDYL